MRRGYIYVSRSCSRQFQHQKKNLYMLKMSLSLDQAFGLAKEAQDLESRCEYGDAATRYMEAVKLFLGAIPKLDEKSSKLIRSKTKIMLDRAESCKRRDIPKAPRDEDEEEEDKEVDETTFEARLEKLKRIESSENEKEPTEASILERFARYKGIDPKKAQADREAEAIQRRRWLAGLGGPPKKMTEGEQRAKLLERMRDEVRISGKEKGTKDDDDNDDVDVDPMSVLNTDSINFDLTDGDDDGDETVQDKQKDQIKQQKLTSDAQDLISQAKSEISRTKNEKKNDVEKEKEDDDVELPKLFHDQQESSDKKYDTLLVLFEKKIITKEQYEAAKQAEALHMNALKLTGQEDKITTTTTTTTMNKSLSKSTSGEVSALNFLLPEAPQDEPKIKEAKKTSDLSEVEDDRHDFKELVSFLRRCGLEHLYGRLYEWGIKCVLDLDEMDQDELADMGVSRSERRRLLNGLRRYEW